MNYQKQLLLRAKLGDEWFDILKDEFDKPYMIHISNGLKQARKIKRIYPHPDDIFKAFKLTPFSKIKVIWLGQDPYNRGEANGLSFDCSKVDRLTPSMDKILGAYNDEIPNSFPVHLFEGDLSHWAKEGVFLLNASLTVPHGKPAAHMVHWLPFTSLVLEKLFADPNPKVFVALGNWAKDCLEKIPKLYSIHPIIRREHPAYAARQGRKWDSKGLFGEINSYLDSPIDW